MTHGPHSRRHVQLRVDVEDVPAQEGGGGCGGAGPAVVPRAPHEGARRRGLGQADGGGPEQVEAVAGIHLERQHAAGDALLLQRDGGDVLHQLPAQILHLGHEEAAAERDGLAVVICHCSSSGGSNRRVSLQDDADQGLGGRSTLSLSDLGPRK